MDNEFFINLLPLVNDKLQFQSVQDYAKGRIDILLQQLSTERDMNNVVRIQGAIAELRRFSTLREEVIKGSGKWAYSKAYSVLLKSLLVTGIGQKSL